MRAIGMSSPILLSLLIALVNLMVCQRHLSETNKNGDDLFLSSQDHTNLKLHLSRVVVDDLVWHVPRPKLPRHLGWEDEFMTRWKRQHYDPSRKLSCGVDSDHSPYQHPLLCHVPGYVPARLPLSPQSQAIPRVLFLSWMTRELGRSIFTSVMSILHHNPEYELVFFTDNDVDSFVCENFPDLAPYFFGLSSGAARTDVWRMMIMEKYGGVYLDMDTSALGHLPINSHDTVVSGVGCWSHVPSQKKGLLEHWALAFAPHHPLIQTTLDIIQENLRHPNNTHVEGEDAKKMEDSYVIRLTGPATYQRALHRLLRQSDCRLDGSSYCTALRNPRSHCNYSTFNTIFGHLATTHDKDLNNSITQKMLDSDEERYILGHKHYNNPAPKYVQPTSESSHSNFCSKESLDAGSAKREQLWLDAIEKAKSKRA